MGIAVQIYIASSFKNFHAVQMLRDLLHSKSHTVLDWTQMAPPLPAGMLPEQRRAALDADDRGQIFDFCAASCASADLVVYLGPSGQDAACEVGMAFVSGVPIFGLGGPLETPGLILNKCVHRWFKSAKELLKAIEDSGYGRLAR